jgi:hypothetical protein
MSLSDFYFCYYGPQVLIVHLPVVINFCDNVNIKFVKTLSFGFGVGELAHPDTFYTRFKGFLGLSFEGNA